MNRDSGAERRRSSLKNPQVQQELRHIKDGRPSEMFSTGFSGFKVPDMRHSGNSMRNFGSLPVLNRTSGIPKTTPRGRQNLLGGRDESRSLAITAAVNRSMAPGSAASRPRSTSTSSKSSLKSIGSLKPSSGYSGKFNAKARRKSKSYESLMQTPSFSVPCRSRSKSPGSVSVGSSRRGGGLLNDAGDQMKNSIKITSEKKVLAEMARHVYAFLEEQDCAATPGQWKDIMNPPTISISKFTAILKFLASHFVGDSYFGTAKGDEEIAKIMEFAKLLKYPSQLSKSHLKTANTQHAWPTCLTFLFWLTCRVQSMLDPPQDKGNIFELNSNGLEEAALISYLNLFPLHFERALTPESIAEELENFKIRVYASHGIECSQTLDELRQERQNKIDELEKLQREPNPTQVVRQRLEDEKATQIELQAKIVAAENKCKEYSNVNHLDLDQEAIKLDIKAQKDKLDRLKQQIQKQHLSKEEAIALNRETDNLNTQIESITVVNQRLEEEYQTRSKKRESLMKELSEICREFSIVEQYNELVCYLHIAEAFSIPANPFESTQLDAWFKEATKTLRRAGDHVQEMNKQIVLSGDRSSNDWKVKKAEMENVTAKINDYRFMLNQLQNHWRCLHEKHETLLKEDKNILMAVCEEFKAAEHVYKEASHEKRKLQEQHKEYLNDVEDHRKLLVQTGQKYKATQDDFIKQRGEAEAYMHKLTEQLAKAQGQAYDDIYGINSGEKGEEKDEDKTPSDD